MVCPTQKGAAVGSEGVLGALAGMIGGALLGFLIALALKAFMQRPNLSVWPILLVAFLGGMLPAMLHNWRFS